MSKATGYTFKLTKGLPALHKSFLRISVYQDACHPAEKQVI